MELQGTSECLQEPAIGTCLEPDVSRAAHPIPLAPKFILILSSNLHLNPLKPKLV
jgi:hypothetical protein